ncbi:hypothetical protein SAMN06265373_103115 [Shimia sagamensis]|uniref:Uncharacterized protein n=1 Tax=Shimia sagamensis TaxID=1566352 RepID=A0ABY1NUI6_9RHOB|nr:hypothetical protein SAMN06265373_103115 [Shimia sagamensis]
MLLTFGQCVQISSNIDRLNERNLLHMQEIGTSAKQSHYRCYTDV